MPILVPMVISVPSNSKGTLSTWISRSAAAPASFGVATASSSTANSSPPRRATSAPSPLALRRRSAAAFNRRSPTVWPKESLTALK
jgi:hypothetical protein